MVLDWGEDLRQGIVHRLDRVTSGLIICAYEENTFTALRNEFSSRSVNKSYYAIVENKVTSNKGVIDAPIGPDPRNKAKQKVVKNGRKAITEYEIVYSVITGISSTELIVIFTVEIFESDVPSLAL